MINHQKSDHRGMEHSLFKFSGVWRGCSGLSRSRVWGSSHFQCGRSGIYVPNWASIAKAFLSEMYHWHPRAQLRLRLWALWCCSGGSWSARWGVLEFSGERRRERMMMKSSTQRAAAPYSTGTQRQVSEAWMGLAAGNWVAWLSLA